MKTNHVTQRNASGNFKYILASLFFILIIPVMAHSQSAISQLEHITGQKITKYGSGNSNLYFQNAVKMQLVSGIASALLNAVFSDNTKNNQAAIQQAALLAKQAAAEKHYHDSIAQAKYEKMMKSYKLLDDPNAVHFKTLSATGTQFKSLDQSAPMTMAEMERQKIIKKGINVTWDYNSWAQIPQSDNQIADIPATPQQDAADQYMGKAIDKIETFQGGKIAALAGRYMMNIKNESMSYLKDATDAVTSGDVYRMQEVGQMDLRKMSTNALINTGKQTMKALVNQGKGYMTGQIKSANFAVMQSGGETLLKNYGVYSHVSDAWKVPLTKY